MISQQNEESFRHQLDRNTSDAKNIDDRDLKSSEGEFFKGFNKKIKVNQDKISFNEMKLRI